MRITDVEGRKVWINGNRVDSMTECLVGKGDDAEPGTRIVTPGATYATTDDFGVLADALDQERKRQ